MKLKRTASKLSIGIKAIRFNIKVKKEERHKKTERNTSCSEDRAPLTIPEMYISRKIIKRKTYVAREF